MSAIDPTLPEPVRRFLSAGGRLESIVLDGEGRFWHQGQPFENPRLIDLFHRSIKRTPGGTWVLSIPPFTYPIVVCDTPYHVRAVVIDGERLLGRLSDGTEEELLVETLRHVPGRGLYCDVKGGAFQARLSSPAYYALGEHIRERGGAHVLTLGGREIAIPEGGPR